MRRANIVSGMVLAAFGLLTLFVIIPWQIEAGPQDMVSPRLVPNLMMILIVGLSVLLVITNLRAAVLDPEEEFPIKRGELVALAKIGAIFAVALGLYFVVSPLVAAIVLVVGTLLVLGERRPLVILAMPAGLLLAIWFLFYKILGTAIV